MLISTQLINTTSITTPTKTSYHSYRPNQQFKNFLTNFGRKGVTVLKKAGKTKNPNGSLNRTLQNKWTSEKDWHNQTLQGRLCKEVEEVLCTVQSNLRRGSTTETGSTDQIP